MEGVPEAGTGFGQVSIVAGTMGRYPPQVQGALPPNREGFFVLDEPSMMRFHTLVALVLCAVGAFSSACASSGSSKNQALLVTLHDYKSGGRYELASESHTDRVSYYSEERSDAVRKIQTDEAMSAFVRELERQGLGEHAIAGQAPGVASRDVIRWGIEIESPSNQVHWLVGTGSSPDDWKAFQQCRDMFLQLYNITVSFQTVQNTSGKEFFQETAPSTPGRAPR